MALRFYNTFKVVYASQILTTFVFFHLMGVLRNYFKRNNVSAKNMSQSPMQQALWKENREKKNVINMFNSKKIHF